MRSEIADEQTIWKLIPRLDLSVKVLHASAHVFEQIIKSRLVQDTFEVPRVHLGFVSQEMRQWALGPYLEKL